MLTDNGIQFTFPQRYADGPTARYVTHMFDMRCQENGIEHRLTKVKHTWTNGQVERMNRTIKEATFQRYHYDSHRQLEAHLADCAPAYDAPNGEPQQLVRLRATAPGLPPYWLDFELKADAELEAIDTLTEKIHEADVELEKAMAFWRKAGATAYLLEGEALLAEAS